MSLRHLVSCLLLPLVLLTSAHGFMASGPKTAPENFFSEARFCAGENGSQSLDSCREKWSEVYDWMVGRFVVPNNGGRRAGVDYGSIPDEHVWRYNRYLDNPNTGTKGANEWYKQAQVNWKNSSGPLKREAAYREAFGGTDKVLQTPYGSRQLDVFIEEDLFIVQLKTGPESLTKMPHNRGRNSWAIERDKWLVEQGYEVWWVLEKGGLKPLLDALGKSGIKYHIGPVIK